MMCLGFGLSSPPSSFANLAKISPRQSTWQRESRRRERLTSASDKKNAGTEARRLIGFAYLTRGLFGLFVASEPPVNADVTVTAPEFDVGLEGKKGRVNHG